LEGDELFEADLPGIFSHPGRYAGMNGEAS